MKYILLLKCLITKGIVFLKPGLPSLQERGLRGEAKLKNPAMNAGFGQATLSFIIISERRQTLLRKRRLHTFQNSLQTIRQDILLFHRKHLCRPMYFVDLKP
jgi:hypothetical protein